MSAIRKAIIAQTECRAAIRTLDMQIDRLRLAVAELERANAEWMTKRTSSQSECMKRDATQSA
jgi:hypothetical protein